MVAQSLYDIYKRYLEGTTVEDLTSNGSVRILEPAFIDTAPQYRPTPVALALLVLFAAGLAELYLMRPPIRVLREEQPVV